MINDAQKDHSSTRRQIYCNEILEEDNDVHNETYTNQLKELYINKTLDLDYDFPNQCTSCRITKKLPSLKGSKAPPTIITNNNSQIINIRGHKQNSSSMKTNTNTVESKTKEAITPDLTEINYLDRHIPTLMTKQSPMSISIPTCFLCHRLYPQHMTIYSETCPHVFCKDCAKQIYEKRIETGGNYNDNNDVFYKCPVSFCNERFTKEAIISILSPSFVAYINGNHPLLRSSFEEVNSIQSKRLLQKKSNIAHLEYKQRNVIDINNSQGFYIFQSIRKTYCPYCLSNQILPKEQTHYIICRNCFKIYCKYCREIWVDGHMNDDNILHCKMKRVYRDTSLKESYAALLCQRYAIQLLFIIAAYFIMHIGIILTLRNAFHYHFKEKHKQFLWSSISLFFAILLYIISFPLLIILIPYYPIINIF